jgi:hypothetical protein
MSFLHVAAKFIFMLLCTQTLWGQVVYHEDFQSQSIPPGYILINADGQTVSAGLMQGSKEAWMIGRHPGIDPNNFFAMTSSKYGNRIQADDWMILPSIAIPAGAVLRWKARSSAIDPNAWERYEVLLSVGDRTDTTSFLPVFHETVPYFDQATQNPWFDREIDLSAHAGENVAVAFRGRGVEGFLLFIDDIEIRVLTSNDAAVTQLQLPAYTLNASEPVTAIVKNVGSQEINSLRLQYQLHETTQTEIEDIAGLTLKPGQSTAFVFPVPAGLPAPGRYNIECSILQVNGAADTNPVNDTVRTRVIVVEEAAPKRVLFEKYTGTWCGHCPKGDVVLKSLTVADGVLIKVAVHNSDPMAYANADSITGNFAAGYPSASFDHVRFPGRTRPGIVYLDGWQDYLDVRVDAIVPLRVDAVAAMTADASELCVDIDVSFLGAADGPLLVNAYVIEDSVYRGRTYDQRNYANNDAQWPDLFGLGDPITPFYHRNVVVNMMEGPWGTPLTSDLELQRGERIVKRLCTAVAPEWTTERLSVAAYVAVVRGNHFEREILNSVHVPVSLLTSLREPAAIVRHELHSVYPNPARDGLTLRYDMSRRGAVRFDIIDALGRTMTSFDGGVRESASYTQVLRQLPGVSGWYGLRMYVDGMPAGFRMFMIHE